MIALVLKIMKFITLVIKFNYCTGPLFLHRSRKLSNEKCALSVTLRTVIEVRSSPQAGSSGSSRKAEGAAPTEQRGRGAFAGIGQAAAPAP